MQTQRYCGPLSSKTKLGLGWSHAGQDDPGTDDSRQGSANPTANSFRTRVAQLPRMFSSSNTLEQQSIYSIPYSKTLTVTFSKNFENQHWAVALMY